MTDLISRQAAIEHLKKRLYETALNNNTEHPYYEEMADNRVDVWMNELPAIDPVKHGKWIEDSAYYESDQSAYCSICKKFCPATIPVFDEDGWYVEDKLPNYCPNCGAQMERNEE